ncbi:putative uncharacterized protein DDB_G0277255 [Teleopsis dalmanni]|uniref:putative uncharacterized protein DDB_G0277255 n=1 Tax=Teleopsis dalmanni TaxID=139649 RepID=UPI000D32A001|nr:putative uncharacterized protein DDB_G0277255 [Teleopsis dalmanni]XP_037959741.1 putative uncharacterized protein DDB_G0277255 [Teleopsis dalmanni]
MEKFSVETFDSADYNGCARSIPSIPFTTPYILDCSHNPNTSPLPINSYNVSSVRCGCANTRPFGRTCKPWQRQNLGHISNTLTNNPNGLIPRNYQTNVTMKRGSLQRNVPKRLLNRVQCDGGLVFVKPPPECNPQVAKIAKVTAVNSQNSKIWKFPLNQKTSFHPSCNRRFIDYGGSKSKLNFSPMRKGAMNITYNSGACSKNLTSKTSNQISSRYIKSNKRSDTVYVKSSDITNYNEILTDMKQCESSLTQITAVISNTNCSGTHSSVTTRSSSTWEHSSANDDNIDTQVCIWLNKNNRCNESKPVETENQRFRGNQGGLQYCDGRMFRNTCDDCSFTQHQQQDTEQSRTNDTDDPNTRFYINKNNHATGNCCNYHKKDMNRPHAMYEYDNSATDVDDCSGYQLPKCSKRLQSKDDYNSRSRSKSRKKRYTRSENQRADKRLEKKASKLSEDLKNYENLNSSNPQKFQDNMGKYIKFNNEQISNSANSYQTLRNSGGCDTRTICKNFRNTKIYLPENQNNYKNCVNFVDTKNIPVLRNNPYKNFEDSVTHNKYNGPKNEGSYKYSKNQNQKEAGFIYGETFKDYANDVGQHINDTNHQYRENYKNDSFDEEPNTEGGTNMRYRRRSRSNSRHRYAQSSVNQNRDTSKYINECERLVTCDHCCSRCRDKSNCRYNCNNFSHKNEKSKRNGFENAACGYDNSRYISSNDTICDCIKSRYRSINANNYNQIPLKYESDNDNVRDCGCDCDNSRYCKVIKNITHNNNDLESHQTFGSLNSTDHQQYLQVANNFQATAISSKYCTDETPSKNQKLNHNTARPRKCLEYDNCNGYKKTAEHNLEYFDEFDNHIYDNQTEVFSIHIHPRNQKALETTNNYIPSNAFTEQAHHEPKNVCEQINSNEFKSCKHCQGLRHCLNWSPPSNLYDSNSANSRLREQHEQEQRSDDNESNSIIQIDIDMLPSTSKGIPFQTWLDNATGCCKDKAKSQTKFYCANGLKYFEKTTCKETCNANDILLEQQAVSTAHSDKNEKSNIPLDSEDDETSRLCLSLEIENAPSKSESSNAGSSDCYDIIVSKEISKRPCISEVGKQMQQSNEKSSEIRHKMEYIENVHSFKKEKRIFKDGTNKEIIIDEHVKVDQSCGLTKSEEIDNNWVDIPSESEQNVYANYAKLLINKIAKEKQHKLHRNPRSILRAMLGPPLKPSIRNNITILARSSEKKTIKGSKC